jgi:hypothetical protein
MAFAGVRWADEICGRALWIPAFAGMTEGKAMTEGWRGDAGMAVGTEGTRRGGGGAGRIPPWLTIQIDTSRRR